MFRASSAHLQEVNDVKWFNETCRIKQLTPNYIKVRINGKKSLPLASVQDGHLQRMRIPEAAYMYS